MNPSGPSLPSSLCPGRVSTTFSNGVPGLDFPSDHRPGLGATPSPRPLGPLRATAQGQAGASRCLSVGHSPRRVQEPDVHQLGLPPGPGQVTRPLTLGLLPAPAAGRPAGRREAGTGVRGPERAREQNRRAWATKQPPPRRPRATAEPRAPGPRPGPASARSVGRSPAGSAASPACAFPPPGSERTRPQRGREDRVSRCHVGCSGSDLGGGWRVEGPRG